MRVIQRVIHGVVGTAMVLSTFAVAGPALAAVHPAGTNVVNNGTIYMITDNGQRRPFTSGGAYLSYGFNSWANAVPATPEDMALPEGAFIPPRDGKIVCSDRGADKGTCYLITDGKRAAFTSAHVFTRLGFSFAKALYGDVSFLAQDSNVSSEGEQHRSGVLINKNGTVYLIANGTLLGIPGLDVLATWGYSLSDVVLANGADQSLNQSSVISYRQGAALSPTGSSSINNVSEEALIQGYIDTHPDLPSVTTSAPQDAAEVISLIQKIDALPGSSIDVAYPYMTQKSIEMFARVPAYKAYIDSPSPFIGGLEQESTNIQVFQGGSTALYTQIKKQSDTGYVEPYHWVAQKENGVWKWDFIGSVKYGIKLQGMQNPTNAVVVGTGFSDIAVVDAGYTDTKVSDPNSILLVMVQNNGYTTVKQFKIAVRINSVSTAEDTMYVDLAPTKSVIIAVPIDRYWQIPGAMKAPGNYNTEVTIGFDGVTPDNRSNDNIFSFNSTFR